MDNYAALFGKKLAGGGVSGTDNYNELTNKPSINGTTLSGNKTASNLGLQAEIGASSKVSSDFIDDSEANNKFVSASDISTWNGKQDALTWDDEPTEDSTNAVNSGAVYTANAALQQAINALSGGVHLKGAVDYYSDLPASPSEGDAYTVRYQGTSGTDPLGIEYAWANYQGTPQWIPIGVDPSVFAKATDEAEDRAALVELVDAGAKNCATINNATFTNVNRYVKIPAVCDGNSVLTMDSITSTDTNANTCGFLVEFEDGVSDALQLQRGTPIKLDFAYTKKIKALRFFASDNYNHSGTTNTITITNLMLCTKAAWDISHAYVPYGKTNPELTVLTDEDRASLVEIVDGGAKNFLTENTKNETGQWTNIPVVLQAGSYVLSIGTLSSTDTDATTCQLGLFNSANQNLLGYYPQLNRGNNIVYSFAIDSESSYLRVYSSDTAAHGTGDTVTVTNAMICTKAAWDISHAYQPYRPSWQAMWDAIQALQSGNRALTMQTDPEEQEEKKIEQEEER